MGEPVSATQPQINRRIPCELCPLRKLDYFRDFTPDELKFVSNFKRGELVVDQGAMVLSEGSHSAQLFTLLSGWAFRYKGLEDGRRQILNYLVPGDLVGLQGSVIGEMEHSVEALTAATFCVFQREDLPVLYRDQPGLAFDVTWLAAREERMLDENLLSIGRRSALERAAYLIAFLYQRALTVGLGNGRRVSLPITQQHVADTLGLSIVHTNKTLRKLASRDLIRWQGRSCEVVDEKELLAVAGWDGLVEVRRPLI